MAEQFEKVLFVTENEDIFNSLMQNIQWKRYGFELLPAVSLERDALEKLYSVFPSIVVLDFSLSGDIALRVLQYASSHKVNFLKEPTFFAISCAPEVSALLTCINCGVGGFFALPIDFSSFEQKIALISQAVKEKKSFIKMQEKLQEERLIQKFSQMFLFGAVDDGFDASEDTKDRFTVALVSPYLCGLMGKNQELKIAIDESFAFISHLDFQMEPDYVILFKNESNEAIVRHIERFCRKFKSKESGALLALGTTGEGLQGALDSYKNARLLYSQLFFFKSPAFLTQADLRNDLNASSRLNKKMQFADTQTFFGDIELLVQYIEIYDLQKINALLSQKSKWLCTSSFSPEQIKKMSMAFMINMQKAMDIKHPEKNLEILKTIDLVDLVYTKNYFEEIAQIVRDFVNGIAEAFSANTTNSTVLKVIQYIKNNYSINLKLETLGSLFNCNSAYLGKRLKDYTGVPFNTYVDLIRIEEAKKMLLESPLKIYEISKLIGYSNTDYFYLKFKRHTNMTPKEYRALSGAGQTAPTKS